MARDVGLLREVLVSRPRIRIRYNPVKGLSGQTLADIVNFVAVVAGLGAAPALQAAFAWFWSLGLVAGLLTLVVAGFQFYRARREASPGTWYFLAMMTLVVGLFTLASNLTAIFMVMANPQDSGVVAGFVGYPAFLAWILAEFVNAYENFTKRPMGGPSRLSLVKSVCQMLGALLVWVFVILALRFEAALINGLFWTGAAIALLGTLLGIAAGLWNLQRK